MTNHSNQIKRINEKLLQAQNIDYKLKVFGADSHKYVVNNPVAPYKVIEFEREYSVELPSCYKAFILEFGNGGISFANSAAGPYCGIYPLGELVDEICDARKSLKNECIIVPKMTNEDWEKLTEKMNSDETSDEDFDVEIEKIYGGIMPLGSQGCTYLHGLILNGQYKGKVVNLDLDRGKPRFTFEDNFLDWYERWLDEIISGDLMSDSASWFGYSKGGTEQQLLADFINSTNENDKVENLSGLYAKKRLSEELLACLESLIPQNQNLKNSLVTLLCKYNYERAKPYLIELIDTDLCFVFEKLHYYAKDKSVEWLPIIENNIGKIKDAGTLKYCLFVLEKTGVDFTHLVLPFTKSEDEYMQAHARHSLERLEEMKKTAKKKGIFSFLFKN